MRSLAFGVAGLAAVAFLTGTAPSRADGLFVGVGANSGGVFAGAALSASPVSQGYVTYQAAPLPYVPAAAVRYNRPCSVTDGFRTTVIPCDTAAIYTVGATYAPVRSGYAVEAAGYPAYGEEAPRYYRRHHRHHHHHHALRRLY